MTKSWKFQRDSTPVGSPVSLTEIIYLLCTCIHRAQNSTSHLYLFFFSIYVSFSQRLLFYNHGVTGRLPHVCNQPIKAYVFFATRKDNFATDQKFRTNSCGQVIPLLALCESGCEISSEVWRAI